MIQPVLELCVLFPAAFFCFLATREHLKISLRFLVLLCVPTLMAVCLLGGWLCWRLGWATNCLLLPILVLAAVFFCWVLDLPGWKSVSIFLGVCGACSTLGGLSVAVDILLCPGNTSPWLSPAGALMDVVFCWLLVGLCWYPTTHAVRDLLNTETIVRTWYVFWLLPVAVVFVNLVLVSNQQEIISDERLLRLCALLSLVMTGLVLLFYLLFYLVARELDVNDRLRRENQFLHMQSTQYDALRAAVTEARRARHDLRHHFTALSALAEREAWDGLRRYLAEAGESVPASELILCENPAVDGVAGHYAALSSREGIPFDCALDLPPALPVPEMDVCVVLANLLENALEASRRMEGGKYIRLRASLHSGRLVLMAVENAYSGSILERGGVIQSTKRRGEGIGLQSVAHIAEKSGGYCKFHYGGGTFTANVMLRGGE